MSTPPARIVSALLLAGVIGFGTVPAAYAEEDAPVGVSVTVPEADETPTPTPTPTPIPTVSAQPQPGAAGDPDLAPTGMPSWVWNAMWAGGVLVLAGAGTLAVSRRRGMGGGAA